MESVAFALPVKPDKVEAGYRFIEEVTGRRADEDHQARQLHGLAHVKVWRQKEPIDLILIYAEAPDLQKALDLRRNTDHDYYKWFDAQVLDITGHHWSSYNAETLMDWDQERGHKQKAESRR